MIYGIDPNGNKIKATPKAQAVCPSCQGELVATDDPIKIWHWFHKTEECDSWHDPETEWHLNWKRQAEPEYCEVVVDPHRVD
ncbi:MAG: competence protein CoiA family protein, partial [Chloroflexota bacterium]